MMNEKGFLKINIFFQQQSLISEKIYKFKDPF